MAYIRTGTGYCEKLYRIHTFGCHTVTLSNWSIAQEIERLIQINSIQDVEPDYQFHKDGCISESFTPFNEPKGFYKRGKSTGRSQR